MVIISRVKVHKGIRNRYEFSFVYFLVAFLGHFDKILNIFEVNICAFFNDSSAGFLFACDMVLYVKSPLLLFSMLNISSRSSARIIIDLYILSSSVSIIPVSTKCFLKASRVFLWISGALVFMFFVASRALAE